jgi:hypothetical protein
MKATQEHERLESIAAKLLQAEVMTEAVWLLSAVTDSSLAKSAHKQALSRSLSNSEVR